MLCVDDQIELISGSVGWSTCRGLGYRAGTRLRGALAWWHFWMRAILWRRMGGCVYPKPALWDLISWETPWKQSPLLCELSKLIPADELNPWLLPHPFPLTLCPALALLVVGTQLFFAFYCIIESTTHSRSQWGVVYVLACPLCCDASTVGICGLTNLNQRCPHLCLSERTFFDDVDLFWQNRWWMKGKNSWIDHWYPSIHILQWSFGTWLHTTGWAGGLGEETG